MLRQADLFDEAVPSIQNGSRSKARVGAQQHGYEAGNDGCVAGRLQEELPVPLLGAKPDLCLAAPNLVLVRLTGCRELGQLSAKIDNVLVTVHPVVEEFKLVDDLAVDFLYGLAVQTAIPNLEFYSL